MLCKNFDNVVEICRKKKIIFTKGELDREVYSFQEKSYNIYIINNTFSNNEIRDIIKQIKEGSYEFYKKAK